MNDMPSDVLNGAKAQSLIVHNNKGGLCDAYCLFYVCMYVCDNRITLKVTDGLGRNFLGMGQGSSDQILSTHPTWRRPSRANSGPHNYMF